MNHSLSLLLQETIQETAEAGFTLHWIDWVGVGICGLFTLLGLLRGLWWQVIRLAGLVGAAFLARFLSDPWGQSLAGATEIPSEVAAGLVWVGVFIIGIVITALVGTLGKKSLEAMKLGLVDRIGGLFAGTATGLVMHTSLLVGVAYLAPEEWTQKALEGTYSKSILKDVTTRWPILTPKKGEPAEYLNTLLAWTVPDPDSPEGSIPEGSVEGSTDSASSPVMPESSGKRKVD